MPKLPSLTSEKVIKVLKRKGFVLDIELKEATMFIITQKQKEELLSLFINGIYQKEHCLKF